MNIRRGQQVRTRSDRGGEADWIAIGAPYDVGGERAVMLAVPEDWELEQRGGPKAPGMIWFLTHVISVRG